MDLLYNGFYCFEAITERDLDDGICGICGVIGELYLGDGNQKNCCSIKNVRNFFCANIKHAFCYYVNYNNYFWIQCIYMYIMI